jgi:putative aminopeptidase FrvX
MKLNKDAYRQYYFDVATRLLQTPSPTGYYQEVMEVVREIAEENGCTFRLTRKGCAILTYPGASHDEVLGACAHCDTLGLMVRAINSDGSLNFTKVGSPQMPTLDGEYCTVITRTGKRISGTVLSKSPASHVYDDAASRTRDADNMYIRLDEVVKSADDTRALGIENGDYICIDPKTVVTESGFLKSRFIDDKASVACLLTAMHILHTEGIVPPRDIAILITMYEEVGHGAGYVPEGIVSMLGVDMGCIGRDLACTEYDVSICAKDSGGPYDYPLTSRLIELAKNAGLSYAVDIYPFYGSDVGAMWRAGHDIPGALIGTGVHASHGMERTHYEGIYNTLCLILLYFGV